MKTKITPGLYGTFDIGTTSVKAVVIEVTNNSKRLLHAEEEKLSPLSSFSTEDDYAAHISERIAKLAKKLDFAKCKKVASLFYNRELQVKILDLPNQVTGEQLDNVLKWEAKKMLSAHYKEEEFNFAYSVLRSTPYSVALAVIPRPLLSAFMMLFENAGVKLDSVYTEVFSAKALQPIVDIAGLPALSILNFGYSGTHLNIFSAGKLKFYRYIPSGTSEMSESPKDGELEIYSQKIRFSFDYFRAVSKLSQVDNLYVMGGGSANPEVIPFEQNYFAPTKVYPLDVSSELDISPILSASALDSAREKDKRMLPFVPAIGAGLAGMQEDAESMDLLSQLREIEKEKKLARIANTVPLIVGIVSVIIAIGVLWGIHYSKSSKLADEKLQLNFVEEELTLQKKKLQEKAGSIKNSPIRLCPSSLKVVEPVIASKNALRNFFITLEKVKPESIKVTDIFIRNAQETEGIVLKDRDQESDSELDNKLAIPLGESQIKEDFEGRFLIIHGYGKNALEVSKFSDALTTNPVGTDNKVMPSALLRYVGISMRPYEGTKVEFLLKGELK